MKRIAKFEKVSYEQFRKDYIDTFSDIIDIEEHEDWIEKIYKEIKLPKRATAGSAGHDFYCPFNIVLRPQETIKIPTGIRVKIEDGWVLQCYPRSGLGSKYRLQLDNTVGIIDSDYYHAKNEGHIFAKITNDLKPPSDKTSEPDNNWKNDKKLSLSMGTAFMQGVFVEYGIIVDDDITEERTGGFGSTDKK